MTAVAPSFACSNQGSFLATQPVGAQFRPDHAGRGRLPVLRLTGDSGGVPAGCERRAALELQHPSTRQLGHCIRTVELGMADWLIEEGG
jgi:hypothetical protein